MKLPAFLRRLCDLRGAETERWAGPAMPTKPRVRIRPDGWVVHRKGERFPFHPRSIVETVMQGGLILVGRNAEYAEYWPDAFWTGDARSWRHNIVAYRIADLRWARR